MFKVVKEYENCDVWINPCLVAPIGKISLSTATQEQLEHIYKLGLPHVYQEKKNIKKGVK
jgi:hypothetical protein